MKPSKSRKRVKKKKSTKPSLSPSTVQIQPAETITTEPQVEEEEENEHKQCLDLDWLKSAFSSLSIDQIASAYNDTGRDAFKAAGVLGAQLIDPEAVRIEAKKEKNELKRKRAAASCGIVANVIGKGYVKPSSSCGEGKVRNLERGNGKGLKYSVEEGEEFLCEMLGDNFELGMGVVKDVFGQCGYDVEKALDALLDISASPFNQFVERSSGYYSCTYPEFSSEGSLENNINSFQVTEKKASDLTYHPSEKENDGLPYVEYGCRVAISRLTNSEQQQSSRSRALNPHLQQEVLESLFSIPECPVRDPHSMNWKKVVKQVESFGQGLEYHNANIIEPLLNMIMDKGDEYEVCRSDARKHWNKMRTYYQKAAMVYSRGERAHAAQLSETGRIYRTLARKADEEASRQIFEARNKGMKNVVTIDLHGQHVKEGIRLLKFHLLLFTYIPSVQFLKVITGCGGDGAGKGKLKSADGDGADLDLGSDDDLLDYEQIQYYFDGNCLGQEGRYRVVCRKCRNFTAQARWPEGVQLHGRR